MYSLDLRVVPSFPNYIASKGGVVLAISSLKTLKPFLNSVGYARVGLWRGGHQHFKLLHRVVASTFMDFCLDTGPQLNHKDGNKINCAVSNLERSSPRHNMQHAQRMGLLPYRGRKKLTPEQIDEAITSPRKGKTIQKLALKYGVSVERLYELRRLSKIEPK